MKRLRTEAGGDGLMPTSRRPLLGEQLGLVDDRIDGALLLVGRGAIPAVGALHGQADRRADTLFPAPAHCSIAPPIITVSRGHLVPCCSVGDAPMSVHAGGSEK
jgi:hypothetical protein